MDVTPLQYEAQVTLYHFFLREKAWRPDGNSEEEKTNVPNKGTENLKIHQEKVETYLSLYLFKYSWIYK